MRNKNTPKLIFRRSWLYDQALARGRGFKMSQDKIFDVQLRKLEKAWAVHGERILSEITKVTKLNWHEKEIVVYVTAGVVPYSDPLTLDLYSDIDTLTHELIHRILSETDNWKHVKFNWIKLMRKYRVEADTVKTHIIIHAIHAVILKNLFGEKRLKKQKELVLDPDFIRLWVIAEAGEFENIVKELTQGLR